MAVNLRKPGFAFGEVVDILAEIFEINSEKRDTFIARLQQLQKAGIPGGSNLGRGTKVRYSASQLITMLTALDLLDCGATPATLATFFSDPDGSNVEELLNVADGVFGRTLNEAREKGVDFYFIFRPAALSYLQNEEGNGPSSHPTLLVDRDDRLLERISEKPGTAINVSQRVERLRRAIESVVPSQIEELRFLPTADVGSP